MIVYKSIPFSHIERWKRWTKAMEGSHAVEIDGIWYFPLQAEYHEKSDTVQFKLDKTIHYSM